MSDADSKVVEPGPEQILADWLDVELRKLQLPQQSVEEIHAAVEALRVEALSAINELRQELEQSHDSLTGVGSRRGIEARLAMEWERSRRYGRPLSLVAIEVNRSTPASNGDNRTTGDVPLRSVASRLVETVRASDFVGRVVGDEFVLICPEADEEAARGVTTKIIDVIVSGLAGDHDGQNGHSRPTVSAGWATRREGQTAGELLQDADRALYRSNVGGGGTAQGRPENSAASGNRPRDEQAERAAHYKWMERR
jgi:diguanylate cyclase (GGDEF)-like protein